MATLSDPTPREEEVFRLVLVGRTKKFLPYKSILHNLLISSR